MKRALVTGATGFLGYHVVQHLTELGYDVTCLVRATSNVDRVKGCNPRFVHGNVTDPDSVRRAVADKDVVYHLAGLTKSLRLSELRRVNVTGSETVAACCARRETPPVLVIASSLAAAGPAPNGRPLTESDPAAPVSHYGRSKRDGELAVSQFASQVPTTILRPPIVLGEGDRDGLAMFKWIAQWGMHHLPTITDHRFSVVHVEDLAVAMQMAEQRGQRVCPDGGDQGLYFVAADEAPTYAELGRMIGRAVGRRRIWVIRHPRFSIWVAAAANELFSRLVRRRQRIFNLDKAREATAGSWTCATNAIRRDVGFAPAQPLQYRLRQTADWYVQHDWMQLKRAPSHGPDALPAESCW